MTTEPELTNISCMTANENAAISFKWYCQVLLVTWKPKLSLRLKHCVLCWSDAQLRCIDIYLYIRPLCPARLNMIAIVDSHITCVQSIADIFISSMTPHKVWLAKGNNDMPPTNHKQHKIRDQQRIHEINKTNLWEDFTISAPWRTYNLDSLTVHLGSSQ